MWFRGKEYACKCIHGIYPRVGNISWRRKWQPIPVFLPEKPHGWRNLVGYCPWGPQRVGSDLAIKQQQNKCWHTYIVKYYGDIKSIGFEEFIKKK